MNIYEYSIYFLLHIHSGCPRSIVANVLDGDMVMIEFQTPVGLLCSLLDKHPWGKYELPYTPAIG